MRRRAPLSSLAAAAVLLGVLLGVAGCTGSGEESASDPPPPTLAGTAEARALATLPTGPSTGTAVLAYTGVGEVREPFTGTCGHDGDATTVNGSADTARIRIDVASDGARVSLDDAGVRATSQLAAGRYEVVGGSLALTAPLVSGGRVVGSLDLRVDCGR